MISYVFHFLKRARERERECVFSRHFNISMSTFLLFDVASFNIHWHSFSDSPFHCISSWNFLFNIWQLKCGWNHAVLSCILNGQGCIVDWLFMGSKIKLWAMFLQTQQDRPGGGCMVRGFFFPLWSHSCQC